MKDELESTATLLTRVRTGDDGAQEKLCSLYLPILTKWAHGRLPDYVRDLSETDDMVQTALLKAMNKLDTFKPLHEGSFLAYLRKILLNNIRMEIRRFSRQAGRKQILSDVEVEDLQPSMLEQAIGTELLDKYEHALADMPSESREAVILRVEFGFSYPEIAESMNLSSANAARMKVSRSVTKLAELM